MRTWSLTSDLKHRQLGLLAALWFAGAVLASIIIMHETNEVFDNAMSETANAVMAMMLPGDQTSLEARDRIERVALAGDRRKYMTFQLRDLQGAIINRSVNAPEGGYTAPLVLGYWAAARCAI